MIFAQFCLKSTEKSFEMRLTELAYVVFQARFVR